MIDKFQANLNGINSPLVQTLSATASALEKLKINYAVIGGFASVVFGAKKEANDIDILVEPGAIEKIARAFPEQVSKWPAWLERYGVREFGGIIIFEGNEVDFFEQAIIKQNNNEYLFAEGGDLEVLQKRVPLKINSQLVQFISREDLILGKAVVARTTSGKRDLKDVEEMLEFEPQLDFEYLKRRAIAVGGALVELQKLPALAKLCDASSS